MRSVKKVALQVKSQSCRKHNLFLSLCVLTQKLESPNHTDVTRRSGHNCLDLFELAKCCAFRHKLHSLRKSAPSDFYLLWSFICWSCLFSLSCISVVFLWVIQFLVSFLKHVFGVKLKCVLATFTWKHFQVKTQIFLCVSGLGLHDNGGQSHWKHNFMNLLSTWMSMLSRLILVCFLGMCGSNTKNKQEHPLVAKSENSIVL